MQSETPRRRGVQPVVNKSRAVARAPLRAPLAVVVVEVRGEDSTAGPDEETEAKLSESAS